MTRPLVTAPGACTGRRSALAQDGLRRHNEAAVLTWLRDHGPAPRSRIAAATSITKAGASYVVDRLLEAGLVEELAPTSRHTRGRPSIPIRINANAFASIGLELNVFHSSIVVCNLDGEILHVARHTRSGQHSDTSLGPETQAMVAEAVTLASEACGGIAGVMVAAPGYIDACACVVRHSPMLGWVDVPIATVLDGVVPPSIRVGVESVSRLASMAEYRLARAGSVHSLVHVELNVAVGSALVVNGEPERGSTGSLGALGHIGIEVTDGPLCHCGRRGCIETLVGLKPVIQRCAPDLIDQWGADPAHLVSQLVDRAERAEPRVLDGLAQTAQWLSTVVALVVEFLDPTEVVLGGYAPPLAPWLMPSLNAALEGKYSRVHSGQVRVIASPLGGMAPAIGAAQAVSDFVLSAEGRL